MPDAPDDDITPGATSPEDTWARLQRLPGDDPAPEPRPARRQYHVAAPTGPPVPPPPPAPRPSASPTPSPPPPARPAPAPAPAPTPEPARPAEPSDRARRRRRPWYRPKLRWLYLYLPLLVLLLVGGVALWGWNELRSLNRVDLGDALATPSGDVRNYLIVGSDSREGLEPGVANEGAIGLDVTGRRSDTIIVLRLEGEAATMVSIPRDLWVRNPATGREGRINATYRDGPANLVRAVTQNLGLPIHHYLEVDFKSFSGMVDAMGGITVDFANPAYDRSSGLNILKAGPARLDGSQALAYVRSRHYVEIVDGQERPDPRADLGRQERQQTFIRSTLSEVGATRNPVTLARIAAAGAGGTRVDQEFGFGDAVGLARRLGSTSPESVVLPTTPTQKGGAAVLVLKQPDALAVLQQSGAGK